jgi:hypothetical protein
MPTDFEHVRLDGAAIDLCIAQAVSLSPKRTLALIRDEKVRG